MAKQIVRYSTEDQENQENKKGITYMQPFVLYANHGDQALLFLDQRSQP